MGHIALASRRSSWFRDSSRVEIQALERRRLLSVAGVSYGYYEGAWTALPNFATLTPVKSGLTHNFDISIRNKDTDYGFKWTGNISIPTTGTYTFYSGSTDGSELLIDGTVIVNNDGVHAYTVKSGTDSLSAGSHTITEEYFLSTTAGQQLTVSYSGPSITKQAIPDSILTTTAPATVDVSTYGAVGNGTTNDSADIQAAIAATPDGGTLDFDSGKTYLLGSGLTMGRPINVEGNGATLLLDTSAYPQNETVFYLQPHRRHELHLDRQTVTAGQTTFNVRDQRPTCSSPGDTIFLHPRHRPERQHPAQLGRGRAK